jgi:hypothetical protein
MLLLLLLILIRMIAITHSAGARAFGATLKISDFWRESINTAWKIGLPLRNSLAEVEIALNVLKDGRADLIRGFLKISGHPRMKRNSFG